MRCYSARSRVAWPAQMLSVPLVMSLLVNRVNILNMLLGNRVNELEMSIDSFSAKGIPIMYQMCFRFSLGLLRRLLLIGSSLRAFSLSQLFTFMLVLLCVPIPFFVLTITHTNAHTRMHARPCRLTAIMQYAYDVYNVSHLKALVTILG